MRFQTRSSGRGLDRGRMIWSTVGRMAARCTGKDLRSGDGTCTQPASSAPVFTQNTDNTVHGILRPSTQVSLCSAGQLTLGPCVIKSTWVPARRPVHSGRQSSVVAA